MGLLIILSSPSGGGKDVVLNALLKKFPNSVRFVTTTSRPLRPGNSEGVDYHFISAEQFKDKIAAGDFIEYNNYAGNYYGTEKKRLAEVLKKYDLIITQIEVNGKHGFDKASIPHLSIYLLPENLETLKKRIKKRGGLTPEIIEQRMEIAKQEIIGSKDYNFRIVNYDGKLAETTDNVAKIIQSYLDDPKLLTKKAK